MKNVKFYFENPVDLIKIEETYKLSFNKSANIDWIRWRFLKNPNTDKVYIAYIESDNKIVSCCTGTPLNLIIDGKGKYKFIHTHHGFTHPDYQGKGLFQETIKALFERIRADSFIGEINFCNHNSHASYRNIKERVELSILTLFCTSKQLFRQKMISDFSKRLNYSFNDVNESILRIASNLKYTTGKVHFSRDYDLLKWRFLLIPNKSYKYISLNYEKDIVAILIFKQFEESIDFMEFFYKEELEKDKYNLMASTVHFLLELGHQKINLWSNLHSKEHVELEKFGFQETVFSTYLGMIQLSQINEITHYSNWHLRFTDSDVF